MLQWNSSLGASIQQFGAEMFWKVGVDKGAITNVSVYDTYSFVTAPFDVAEKILRNFREEQRGRKPMVSKAKR